MHYKAYCFDLDGTVIHGKTGIATAVAFIHKLQDKGIEPFYVTNNSSKTREQLKLGLQAIGVDAPLTHIYSSALATARYVAKHFVDGCVQVIGSDGIRHALEAEAVVLTDAQPDVLVMGIDRKIDYKGLAEAGIAVQNGATLIGTNGDIKYPTEIGFMPGNGSLVQLVANVAGVEPIFIGKPSPVMLQIIADEHAFTKQEMVMIGDNYDTDILCGIYFGCDTIHVNTGVTSANQVREKPEQPTFLVEDLSKL